ncbi:RTA1-domain-containing protein [Lactarius indigo]|nr:RTA1-domain-containing protein [Lactarius indigo]
MKTFISYVPTEWVCIMFITLFAISTTLHIAQAVRSRLWWLFQTAVLSGIAEILGRSGRLWSSPESFATHAIPYAGNRVSALIMAPTFLIATNFMVLGKINQVARPAILPHVPKVDIVALIVQAIGDGIASGTQLDLGGHIALGGIVLQLDTITHSMSARTIGLMITGLSTMTIFFLIRSVYRTIELSGGWSGKIISTQWLFNAFDGNMIVLATFTLNFLHPGVLLRGYDRVRVGSSTEKAIGSASSQSA